MANRKNAIKARRRGRDWPQGPTVRVILPASIATFRGLLIQAGRQPFLLPTEAVERVIRITQQEVERVGFDLTARVRADRKLASASEP